MKETLRGNKWFILFVTVIAPFMATLDASVFPKNERGKALGINGAFVALGIITGPSLGGFIVSAFGWAYMFWINIPIGIFIGKHITNFTVKNTVSVNAFLFGMKFACIVGAAICLTGVVLTVSRLGSGHLKN